MCGGAWHPPCVGTPIQWAIAKTVPLGDQAGGKDLWIFVAQHLARSAMDEVKPGARRTIDALVLVFGRIIAVLQPLLDPLVGDGTGEYEA